MIYVFDALTCVMLCVMCMLQLQEKYATALEAESKGEDRVKETEHLVAQLRAKVPCIVHDVMRVCVCGWQCSNNVMHTYLYTRTYMM